MGLSRRLLVQGFVGLVLVTWQVCEGAILKRDVQDNLIEYDELSDVIDLSHLGPELYGEPDEAVGELVKHHNPESSGVNVEELGSYLQGDILIERPEGRNGLASNATRWPKGVVPFVISGNFNAVQMDLIEQAINQYHSKTCVRFVSRTKEKDYVSFESSSSGCWSSVGRIGGKQSVNLQIPGCTSLVGTVIHEMMHALGFLHEQNREDRDGFVSIKYQNIKDETVNNFVKAKDGTTNSFGVQYDYDSVMHYSANAFSKNGQPTIVAKTKYDGKMGQRANFSKRDLQKINKMYNCK